MVLLIQTSTAHLTLAHSHIASTTPDRDQTELNCAQVAPMGWINSPWGRYVCHVWGGRGPHSERSRTFDLLDHELESVYRVYNVSAAVGELLAPQLHGTSRGAHDSSRHSRGARIGVVHRQLHCRGALQTAPPPARSRTREQK